MRVFVVAKQVMASKLRRAQIQITPCNARMRFLASRWHRGTRALEIVGYAAHVACTQAASARLSAQHPKRVKEVLYPADFP